MNEEQFAAVLSEIPPEVLLQLITMILDTPPDQLQQLIQQLEEAVGAQQGGAPPAEAPPEAGQQNLYG